MAASEEFLQKVYDMATDYGYIDEPQDGLLRMLIQGTIIQLEGSGVPVQEDDPEYLMAVSILAAYRYVRRTMLATSPGANDEDMQYLSMLRDMVWRLRVDGT